MSQLKTLNQLKDFMQPGINGINYKNGSSHTMVVDGDKLKLATGKVLVDNRKCKTGDDQIAQVNKAFNQLKNTTRV